MLKTNVALWSTELAFKSVIRICIYIVVIILLLLIIIALIKACFKKKKKPDKITSPNQKNNIEETKNDKEKIETELLAIKNNLQERH